MKQLFYIIIFTFFTVVSAAAQRPTVFFQAGDTISNGPGLYSYPDVRLEGSLKVSELIFKFEHPSDHVPAAVFESAFFNV